MKYKKRQTSVSYCVESIATMHGINMTWGRKKRLTSSSFSGRPFNPPLGSCRSDNHQARVSTFTTSNLSRIARAATQTKTVHSG